MSAKIFYITYQFVRLTKFDEQRGLEKRINCLVLLGDGADLGNVDGGLLQAEELLDLLGGSDLRNLGDSHGDLDALLVVLVSGPGALCVVCMR
jgi:hypothetical protein